MPDLAELQLVVDSSQVQKGADALGNLDKAATNAQGSADSLKDVTAKLGTTLDRLIQTINAVNANMQGMGGTSTKALADITMQAKSADNALKSLDFKIGNGGVVQLQAFAQELNAIKSNASGGTAFDLKAIATEANHSETAMAGLTTQVQQLTTAIKELAAAQLVESQAGKEQEESVGKVSTKVGGLHGWLNQIKNTFGRGSTFKEVGELLAGAGVIAGVTLMAGQVQKLAEEYSKLHYQYATGKISAEEYADSLLRQIPVFGQLYSAAVAVRYALTGEKDAEMAEIERNEMRIKQYKQLSDALERYLKIRKELTTSLEDTQIQAQIEATILAAPEGLDRQLTEIELRLKEHLRRINKEISDAFGGNSPSNSGGLTGLKSLPANWTDDVGQQLRSSIAARYMADHADDPNSTGSSLVMGASKFLDKVTSIPVEAVRLQGRVNNPMTSSDDRETARTELNALIKTWYDVEKSEIAATDALKAVGEQQEQTLIQKDMLGKVLGIAHAWDKGIESIQKFGAEATKQTEEWKKQMIEAGKAVTDSVMTPEEALAKTEDKLKTLLTGGFIDQTAMTRAMKAATDVFTKAKDQEILKAEEAQVMIAAGDDKLREQLKLGYMKDLASYREALGAGTAAYGQARDARLAIYHDALDKLNSKLVDDKLIAQDQLKVALTRGLEQQIASFKLQYDEDLANWHQITTDKNQLAEISAQLQIDLQQKIVDATKKAREQDIIQNGSFVQGMQLGFEKLHDTVATAGQRGVETANALGDAFSQAFEDMVLGAKDAKSAVKDLLLAVEKLFLQELVMAPLKGLVSGFAGSLLSGLGFGGASGGFGGGASITGTAGEVGLSPTTVAALGVVMSKGNVHPFASGGTMVNRPTYFPMAGNQWGLMGEAGPEAVMPLTRDKQGRLGVRGGGGVTQNINVQIVTPNPDGFRKSRNQIANDVRRATGSAFQRRNN